MSVGSTLSWCTIESDPGVFTQMLTDIGVRGVEVRELYTLDETHLNSSKVYGLVMLFRYEEKSYRGRSARRGYAIVEEHDSSSKIFFAKQVIANACATQAMLSVVMNVQLQTDQDESFQLGTTLTNLREFSASFTPELKGIAIGNCPLLQNTHNSYARPEILTTTRAQYGMTSTEDEFHFTSFVPIGNTIFELDGLRDAPVDVGSADEKWLTTVTGVIKKRMKSSKGSIHYNLMAVCKDRRLELQEKIQAIECLPKAGVKSSEAREATAQRLPASKASVGSVDKPSARGETGPGNANETSDSKKGSGTESGASEGSTADSDASNVSNHVDGDASEVDVKSEANLSKISAAVDKGINPASNAAVGSATAGEDVKRSASTPVDSAAADDATNSQPATKSAASELRQQLAQLRKDRLWESTEARRKQHNYSSFIIEFVKVLQKRKILADSVRELASATRKRRK